MGNEISGEEPWPRQPHRYDRPEATPAPGPAPAVIARYITSLCVGEDIKNVKVIGNRHIITVGTTKNRDGYRHFMVWHAGTGQHIPIYRNEIDFNDVADRSGEQGSEYDDGQLRREAYRAYRIANYRERGSGLRSGQPQKQGNSKTAGKASQIRPGVTLNYHVSGDIVLWPKFDHGCSFLRPDHKSASIDNVDIHKQASSSGPDDLGSLWLPVAISSNPGSIPGFPEVYAGVRYKHTTDLCIVGISPTRRLESSWKVHDDEITHLAFTSSGQHVVSLARNKTCRITSITFGPMFEERRFHTKYKASMLQVAGDPPMIVSVWGTDVHVWYPWANTEQFWSYSLNESRKTRVVPLCISGDCQYLACGTNDGFDLIYVASGEPFVKGLGRGLGLCDIQKGAFGADCQSIVVATADNRVHTFELDGMGRDQHRRPCPEAGNRHPGEEHGRRVTFATGQDNHHQAGAGQERSIKIEGVFWPVTDSPGTDPPPYTR
ncbi:hypothetical protein N8I77_000739 [Diaporthe amygdali]|uniref:Uncharacterized protein n=1 Tax=Phomopsis amygdali TaxID=1214568 RepID=A0AAD9SRG5_PHOAM|nr:hypothetical protein N8I77_000739 [Diaporthe amygdali]